MAATCVTAVASFAAATGPLAFVVAFLVDFLEVLLPIRDFLVIAIVVSPQDLELNFFTPIYGASCMPNRVWGGYFL
jgi:hypothetical protein